MERVDTVCPVVGAGDCRARHWSLIGTFASGGAFSFSTAFMGLKGVRMKVLIAEDEALIRLDVKSVLEEHGFQVCEARDGEEAVKFARDPSVDAAFVDVGMPGLDGIEATRQILAGREIPIVLLTAHANEEVVDRALEAGVSGYLVKPFGERALVPALRTAVERHRELVAAKKRGRVPVRSASAATRCSRRRRASSRRRASRRRRSRTSPRQSAC
jgi:DNA-binding response OmpR family regulator